MRRACWLRGGLGFLAVVCLTVLGLPQGAVAQPGAAAGPAADFIFGRSFDIEDPTGGARFFGDIEWGPSSTSFPSQAARITARVADIAPDDYRAVAWIRYDLLTFREVCVDVICGWEIASVEHFTPPPPQGSSGGTLGPVGNATPSGASAPVSWLRDPGDSPEAVINVHVKVCTEQWRFAPNRVIACSPWS